MHRHSSADKIELLLRLHVYPVLGDRRITAVRPSDVQAWVKRLMVEHRLAPSTVAVAHGVLASMFKSAGRDRIVPASPCDGTRLPEKRDAVKEAGMPAGTSDHDLRHFYASLLIDHGERVKVVQRRLRHASATETLDIYSHPWPTARTARATPPTRSSARPVSHV